VSVFDPIITMVRPNRNISSDSSESWKATADEDVKDMKDKENSLNDNDESKTGSTLSSVMGVKLDPHQMVILSGNLSKLLGMDFLLLSIFFRFIVECNIILPSPLAYAIVMIILIMARALLPFDEFFDAHAIFYNNSKI
jgi:hypothetical protein